VGLSGKTVANYVSFVLAKMDAADRNEAARPTTVSGFSRGSTIPRYRGSVPVPAYAVASTRKSSTDSTFMNGGRGAVRAASSAHRAASSESNASTFSVPPDPSLSHTADTKPGACRTRGATLVATSAALDSIC
jgi:hypothetical protein